MTTQTRPDISQLILEGKEDALKELARQDPDYVAYFATAIFDQDDEHREMAFALSALLNTPEGVQALTKAIEVTGIMSGATRHGARQEPIGQHFITLLMCPHHDQPRIEVCVCGETSPSFVHLQGEGQDEVAHCDSCGRERNLQTGQVTVLEGD